ncbi:MAG: 1-(5-phosphoribosyl)-5-[(5-phosphoribosylamino)methylideneamino]imidazole-4-carboxamide isomerase, partial [bacterium]
MIIYPAFDLREGMVVRLTQGDFKKEKIYSEDPLEVAFGWKEKGAEALHIVDLDGAFFGKPQNLEIIQEICDKVKIPIQMGGGIRNFEILEEVMDMGVARAVLGTSAILDELFLRKAILRFSNRILVGLDVKKGKVAISGWQRITDYKLEDLLLKMVDLGLKEVIITDIERDGMMSGPNISLFESLLKKIQGIKIIASGGISSMADMLALSKLPISGMIIGKALYEGKIDLPGMIKLLKDG